MTTYWATKTLGQLVSQENPITYGVVKPGDEDPDGILFIRSGDISDGRILLDQLRTISKECSDQYKRTILKGGDLLISLVGNPGQVAIVPHELRGANIARQVGLIRLASEVETQYVKYFLLSPQGQELLTAHALGSVQQVINLRELKTIEIPIPSLPEQRRIAHILGTLDDKIENNRKTAKTLEAMAQAIFKSWFVDFDPVRAKMAGEPRESICKRLKLTPEILDLFPDRLVDSELGEIPEGWGVGTFGDYADIVGGSTPSTNNPDYWLSGLHSWATPKDLSNLTIPVLLVTENKITDAGLQQISSRLLPVGTVLLSSRAPIGYLAIAEIPVAINQGFIALKPHNREDNIFLMLLIKHNMDEIISRANGSTFLEVSKAKFRPIPVISPAQAILRFFAKLVIPLFLRIASLEKFTRILTIQRDTLLPKLISGEIRVPEAKYCVEAAMSGEV